MSTLIVLGNTNQYTFANSIIAANAKSIELFDEPARDIFVIHSSESIHTLNTKTEWIDHLESNAVNYKIIKPKIIDLNFTQESVEDFVRYIENIVDGPSSKNEPVLVDFTNSTTLYKNLLTTTTHMFDLKHLYVIDTIKLHQLNEKKEFFPLSTLKDMYIPFPDISQLDNLAYLNLVETIRYKKVIPKIMEKYTQTGTNQQFFEENLLHSVQMKMRGDQNKANASYHQASDSISMTVKDLLGALIDELLPPDNVVRRNKDAFGHKLNRVYTEIQKHASVDFDLAFLKKLNDFMLYLYNSSAHKDTISSDIDKIKADLSFKMAFPFIEFYIDIICPLLVKENDIGPLVESKKMPATEPLIESQNVLAHTLSRELQQVPATAPSKEPRRLSAADIKPGDVFYFGLNCTGNVLEDLFLSASDETAFKGLNNVVTTAINEIKIFIESQMDRKVRIIFATDDDMLFRAIFDYPLLLQIQQIYTSMTSGAICSIGYGKTFQEVHFALKRVKKEPGDNSIVGIELV